MIDKAYSDGFKREQLYQILMAKDVISAGALHTYAQYLNRQPQHYDLAPLYLKVFRANNKFAVDALLNGYVLDQFFDFIKMANPFVLKEMFTIFASVKRNTLNPKTIRVFCSFLKRVYSTGKDGYKVFPLEVSHLNSMAKYLDESKNQSDEVNRDILDTLYCLGNLDQIYETDIDRVHVGRQANRIRSDFFDEKRTLKSSFPLRFLEKDKKVDFGIQPQTATVD